MKKIFNEYLRCKPEEVKTIWEDAIVSFDTNVLLNLYRLAPKSSDDMLAIMESLSDQVWLTYQAGYEFFRNRTESFLYADEVSKSLDALFNQIKNLDKLREMEEGYKAHAWIGEPVKKAKELIESICKSYESHLRELRENDTTLQRLMVLFDEKTELPPSEKELEAIYAEGEKRYKESIPPGYKDNKKEKEKRKQYGDLIIWKSLIKEAKSKNKNLIFITDDEKEDWIWETHGKKAGTRPELIREFHKETGRSLLIYNSKAFLDYAKENFKVKPADTTIRDINTINRNKDIPDRPFDAQQETTAPLWNMLESQKKITELCKVPDIVLEWQNNPIVDSVNRINQLVENLTWYEKYFPNIYEKK